MRRKHAVTALFLVVLLVTGAASAAAVEGETPPDFEEFRPSGRYPNALGAAFGPISGIGLHYHRWDKTLGLQVSGGILYFPPGEGPGETSLDYNIGGAVQWQVFGDVFSRWLRGNLYAFVGGNHRGYIPVIISGDPVTFSNGAFQADFTAGPGIGIEIVLFEHFSIPVEFGYGATWTMTEPDLARAFSVTIYGQTALRYRY